MSFTYTMRAKTRIRLRLPIFVLVALSYAVSSQSPLNSSETLDALLVQDGQVLSSSDESNPTPPPPRLIMYVQTFSGLDNKSLSLLPLVREKTGITHVIVGALHLHSTPGKITLNNDPPNSTVHGHIWSDVKELQRNGIKVMAMLGGAAQGSYGLLNGTDDQFNSYYLPLLNLIKQYNLDGLDVDIEEEVHIDVPLRLLKSLYRDMGPRFILTMVPLAGAVDGEDGGNLSGFSYSALDSQATVPGTSTKLVHWYNTMFYGGFARSTSFYKSIIGRGWDPSRIILGVTDSANSGMNPRGFVDLNDLHSTIQELRMLYPTFGGVYGWEYFDAGISDEGNLVPWQWVQRVGRSLFEVLTVSAADKEVTRNVVENDQHRR